MKGLPQRSLLLLILLLPSQVVCGLCATGWCPMQVEPAAAKTESVKAESVKAESVKAVAAKTVAPGCHHQMADPGSADRGVITAAKVKPDCCTTAGDAKVETPAVLTASAAVLTIDAASGNDLGAGIGTPPRPRWAPPPQSQPLYRLHSSLLI
jgi:hypothetical protein